jgi:hypothetical protein
MRHNHHVQSRPQPHRPSSATEIGARAAARAVEEIIGLLAELFPATFIAERWQRHRPLKAGIHLDLIERGVLLPAECRALEHGYRL